ncbi:hypothetical protein KAX08_05585 [candidate division WOR-3 bacterium]|nr:hypothetical protein [candidate division WOR-3 bacterium]
MANIIKLPKIKKIKIGSSWYDVEYVDDLRDETNRVLFGRIFQGLRLIKINKSVCSYQSMLQVLHHESTHGIMWEYGIDDVEDLVEPMSNGNYSFIIDNPELVREILRCAEEMKR